MNREHLIKKELSDERIIANYKASCDGGILKVMSKMVIYALQSYKGAQIFEAPVSMTPSLIGVLPGLPLVSGV